MGVKMMTKSLVRARVWVGGWIGVHGKCACTSHEQHPRASSRTTKLNHSLKRAHALALGWLGLLVLVHVSFQLGDFLVSLLQSAHHFLVLAHNDLLLFGKLLLLLRPVTGSTNTVNKTALWQSTASFPCLHVTKGTRALATHGILTW